VSDTASQADTEVQCFIVEPDGTDMTLWSPPADLTETQKAAYNAYVSAQYGSIAQAQGQAPNAFVSDYETIQAFALAGALAPPEDPRQVANIYRRSSALRPSVEAVADNTVGFGYEFVPVVDLEHADAAKHIRKAIIQDRIAQGIDNLEPTPAEIEETRRLIEVESLNERCKLDKFFGHICPTRSFTRLRWESTVERESGGNAYWEVTRREDGSHYTWDRIEAHTMRLRRTEERYLFVEMNQRRSPLAYESVRVPMRFRTYVQLVLGGAKAVYYKQYGDERTLSSRTGRWYPNDEMLAMAEPGISPATEIIHWSCFDAIGPYGLPQWYGAQYAVMGLLASERVNYDFFDNKAIPPFAIFVSGGKLAAGALDKINEILKGIKGQAAFWKVLVLEAASTGDARCRIELHPLLKAMPEDALFQEYESNNAKKIQQQWRLPDLLVGRSQEANRAQAEAAMQMAEQQVFQKRRETDDDFFNRFILSEMGIRFWKFKTNSAVARDPQLETTIGTAWVKAGVITPNEARPIASDVMNKQYPPIQEPWANIPQPLALAGFTVGQSVFGHEVEQGEAGQEQSGGAPKNNGEQKASLARQIIATRDAMQQTADGGQALADAIGRAKEAAQMVKLSNGDWDALWEK
jgi:capsid portal protein